MAKYEKYNYPETHRRKAVGESANKTKKIKKKTIKKNNRKTRSDGETP
jgi:hypothetical protein